MNPVIVISEADNVGTALEALEPGAVLNVTGSVIVREAIPRGHKVALRPIPAGAAVTKYGSAIGVAVHDIAAGDHVHTHNLSSARGRGDLARPDTPRPADGRLAEPPDEPGRQA